MIDPETGCTEDEMNAADWQALWEEEQRYKAWEAKQEWLKEMEAQRGE